MFTDDFHGHPMKKESKKKRSWVVNVVRCIVLSTRCEKQTFVSSEACSVSWRMSSVFPSRVACELVINLRNGHAQMLRDGLFCSLRQGIGLPVGFEAQFPKQDGPSPSRAQVITRGNYCAHTWTVWLTDVCCCFHCIYVFRCRPAMSSEWVIKVNSARFRCDMEEDEWMSCVCALLFFFTCSPFLQLQNSSLVPAASTSSSNTSLCWLVHLARNISELIQYLTWHQKNHEQDYRKSVPLRPGPLTRWHKTPANRQLDVFWILRLTYRPLT